MNSLFASSKAMLRQWQKSVGQHLNEGADDDTHVIQQFNLNNSSAASSSSERKSPLLKIDFYSLSATSSLNDKVRERFLGDFLASVISYAIKRGNHKRYSTLYHAPASDAAEIGKNTIFWYIAGEARQFPFQAAYLAIDELQSMMFKGFTKETTHGQVVYYKTFENVKTASLMRELFLQLSGAMGMTELLTDKNCMAQGTTPETQCTVEIPAAIYEKMLAQEKPIIIPPPSH